MNIVGRITSMGWFIGTSKLNSRFIEIITKERAREIEQNMYFSHYRKQFYVSVKVKSGASYNKHHMLLYAHGTIRWKI
jgi:hypothetical protein